MTEEERVNKALDTLAELCDIIPARPEDDKYAHTEALNIRRHSAEEILSHYRDEHFARTVKDLTITLNVNGAIPVRPMTRFEMKES